MYQANIKEGWKMMNVSIITLRECIEMLIVIVALATYVVKIDKRELLKYIFYGSIGGLAVSLFTSFFLYNQTEYLSGYAKEFFNGSLMIFLSALVVYYIIWMRRQKKNFNLPIDQRYNIKFTGLGLFIFSFLTILRETLEIVIFIIPLLTGNVANIIFGALIGLALSLIIMLIFFKSGLKLNINLLFDIISLMMIYVGASMFGEGLSLIFQNGGPQLEKVGMLAYGVPALFLFVKTMIRDYIRK